MESKEFIQLLIYSATKCNNECTTFISNFNISMLEQVLNDLKELERQNEIYKDVNKKQALLINDLKEENKNLKKEI